MSAYFEKVSRFADVDIEMPARKTTLSAGYDFVVAEDIIVPAYDDLFDLMCNDDEEHEFDDPISLDELAKITKKYGTKPTLVSTGMKCHLDED